MPEAVALFRIYDLPWSTGAEQEQRFRRIVVQCIVSSLVLALVLSLLPLPQRDASAPVISKRIARLAVERGCGRLEWSVLDWNQRAIDFYRKLGAEPMADWTVYRVSGSALEQLGAAP